MSGPELLWIRGQGPTWPGLAEGYGPGLEIADSVDARSMRDVRTVVAEVRPQAVLYAGNPDGSDSVESFQELAEAPIGIAAAAREFSLTPILVSHPAVFSGPGGPWSESDEATPGSGFAEVLIKGERFFQSASAGAALILRAGPVLSRGLEDERRRLSSGKVRPSKKRQVTPVTDRELGQALKRLVAAKVRGLVHLAGPATDEWSLWTRIAEATGIPLSSSGQEAASWALAADRWRDLGLEPIFDWASALGAKAGSPLARARCAACDEGPKSGRAAPTTVFAQVPKPGRTSLGPGLALLLLEPGARMVFEPSDRALIVRTGRVVVEQGPDEQLLRAGQRVDLDPGEVSRVVAVDATELLVLEDAAE